MRWDGKYYIEIDGETRQASSKELEQCWSSHEQGNCSHAVFTDNHSMMYDYRRCAVCHKQLGVILTYNANGTSVIGA